MSAAVSRDDLPMGTVAESIALARMIEHDQIAANKSLKLVRNSLHTKMRLLRARGAPDVVLRELAEQLHALPPSPSARDVAAAAVGLNTTEYSRALQVLTAAEHEPGLYSDLLLVLEESGAYAAHAQLCKRRGDIERPRKSESYSKNVLLRRGLRPQHNDMMDRAVRALDGAVMGLKLVDLDQLDRKRIGPWLAAFTEVAQYLHRLHKEVIALYDKNE